MTSHQTHDFLIGLILVIVAIVGFFITIPAGIVSPGQIDIVALSPSFWPRIIVAGLGLAGATILLQGLFSSRRNKAPLLRCPIDWKGEKEQRDEGFKSIFKVVICIVGLFAYYFAILKIGIILASTIIIVLFTLLGGERRLPLQLTIAIALPVLLYYFFTYAANIPLPLGMFESWR